MSDTVTPTGAARVTPGHSAGGSRETGQWDPYPVGSIPIWVNTHFGSIPTLGQYPFGSIPTLGQYPLWVDTQAAGTQPMIKPERGAHAGLISAEELVRLRQETQQRLL